MATQDPKALLAEIKKHPIPVAALAGGVGLIIWRARQSAAAAASAIPVPSGAPAPADTGTSVPSAGYPSTAGGTDLTSLTSSLSNAFAQIQSQISGLGTDISTASAAQTAQAAAALPAQEYLAGYTPAVQLQQAAVNATSSAADTLSKNCNKVTGCKGFFSCINPARWIPAAIGCVGQAAITVGTGVSAVALPGISNAVSSLGNYAPSILGGALGIPGLPTKAPTTPAPGVGYYPYGAAPNSGVPYYPYTPPISPYMAAPAAPVPVVPTPVASSGTVYPYSVQPDGTYGRAEAKPRVGATPELFSATPRSIGASLWGFAVGDINQAAQRIRGI